MIFPKYHHQEPKACTLPQKLIISQTKVAAPSGNSKGFTREAVDKHIPVKRAGDGNSCEESSTSHHQQKSRGQAGEGAVGARGGEGRKRLNTKESFRTHLFEQCQGSSLLQYFLPALRARALGSNKSSLAAETLKF